jgi:hypothetical protein
MQVQGKKLKFILKPWHTNNSKKVETKLDGQSGSLYKTIGKYFPRVDIKLLTHAVCGYTDDSLNRVLRIEFLIFR